LAIGSRDAMPRGGRLTLATRTAESGAALTISAIGHGGNPSLSTVAELLQQSGSTLTIVVDPGGGPTLTVMLPAPETTDAERNGHAAEAPQTDAGTVLLVEDQEALRRLAHGILTEAGYQVLEARNGSEGLVISHHYEKPIDLLLTDVVMPGMTGPEMAVRLRGE